MHPELQREIHAQTAVRNLRFLGQAKINDLELPVEQTSAGVSPEGALGPAEIDPLAPSLTVPAMAPDASPLRAPLHTGPGAYDLFVMCGQSNMQGHQGDARGYPPDADRVDPLIPFYWTLPGHGGSDGTWSGLGAQQGNFPSGHFGPEVTFARLLRGVGLAPAVFKYSLGSTSLAADWKAPGAGGMYDGMVAELARALANFEQAIGMPIRIRALVWIQGESDAENEEYAQAFQARLHAIINHFRAEVARDFLLPILLGLDEQHPYVVTHPQVISAQERIAATVPLIARSSMSGLPKADVSHLTPEGLSLHGERLGRAFLALQKTVHSTCQQKTST